MADKKKVQTPPEDELQLVDAVLAAFCFQSNNKLRQPLNVQAVYRTFERLRSKYPNWLQDLRFTYGPSTTVPISGALEDILFDLGANSIMAVKNPWYKFLEIKPQKLELLKKAITRRRNKTEQDQLRKLADEFLVEYQAIIRKK